MWLTSRLVPSRSRELTWFSRFVSIFEMTSAPHSATAVGLHMTTGETTACSEDKKLKTRAASGGFTLTWLQRYSRKKSGRTTFCDFKKPRPLPEPNPSVRSLYPLSSWKSSGWRWSSQTPPQLQQSQAASCPDGALVNALYTVLNDRQRHLQVGLCITSKIRTVQWVAQSWHWTLK